MTPGPFLFVFALAFPQGDGFAPIFDGRSLEGWEGDRRYWRVENGAIVGQSTKENPCRRNTFLIWRRGELDDFELRLRYRIHSGNSGIQYRSRDLGDFRVAGYQADLEAGPRWSGVCYDEHGRGVLALRGQKVIVGDGREREEVGRIGEAAELQKKIVAGGWNDYRVVARGRRLIHEINGQVMSEVEDRGERSFRRRGVLALQLHAGPPMRVEFKDIRLRRLPLEDAKKVVFVAGRPSHGFGAHEHRAGCLLLSRLLEKHGPGVLTAVYDGGWPRDPTAFDNADAVVLYMDGGAGHPVLRHLEQMDAVMARGVGLACLHYAVEVPKEKAGERFLAWIGGYFETNWSVNPHWTARFDELPEHPVTRGVAPFTLRDEWYYHMRFRAEMRGVTPLLTAVPPDSTRERRFGPHSGNPHVRARKGMPEHVAWAAERADGGRGFGITGGHFHWNWGHDRFRTLVLNALVWIAHGEVPEDGVRTPTPTVDELLAEQDEPVPARFERERIEQMLRRWNAR